jgi:hypothetical protein
MVQLLSRHRLAVLRIGGVALGVLTAVSVPDWNAVAGHGPPALPEGRGDDVIGGIWAVVVEVVHGPMIPPIGAAGKAVLLLIASRSRKGSDSDPSLFAQKFLLTSS